MTRFDTDTGVTPAGPGRYRARIDDGWWITAGPNGGYVAAIVVRALEHAVGDPSRSLRSLTVHYLARPEAGPAEIEVTVERAGRSLSSLSARLYQGQRLLATALAAMSTPRPGPEFGDAPMPQVPPPEELPGRPFGDDVPPTAVPAMAARYEQRWALGPPPFSGGDEALAGGWIRLAERRPVDAAVLVAFTDAWMPAMFGRVRGRWGFTTVDLTVHVRSLPPAGWDGWCFARYRSVMSAEGFCEEDAEIWSADGQLLAQSRQLAALPPVG